MEDLKPVGCDACDFCSGQRGMDTCGKCDGTGSVFWVNRRRFPNTKAGYINACKEAGVKPVID